MITFRRDYVNTMRPEVGVIFVTVRGWLLWIVMPCGFVAWATYYWWRRKASLGQCLGWFDLNVGAFLQRKVLRRFIPHPSLRWVPSDQMSAVTHRVTSGSSLDWPDWPDW